MNLHFELIGAAATVSLVLGSIWFLSKYLFCQDEFYIPNRKKHNWKPLKFLSRASHCSICEILLSASVDVFCDCCGICSHPKCVKKADKILFCKEKIIPSNQELKHRWIKGNLPLGVECCLCKTDVDSYSEPGLFGLRCCWCQRTTHTNCLNAKLKDESCDLGEFKNFIIPPNSLLVKSIENKSKLQLTGVATPDLEEWNPLIIIANVKSGSSLASRVACLFRLILHPVQVHELDGHTTPTSALMWASKISPVRCKIVVAGGDGTVGWVLSAIKDMNIEPMPEVSVIPLGTGNDLSRVLGWGNEESSSFDAVTYLKELKQAHSLNLDRWMLDINSLPSRIPRRQTKKSVCWYNYFSIGVDAMVTFNFHKTRESLFHVFSSTLVNRILYLFYGTHQVVQQDCLGMEKEVQLFIDGRKIDLPELQSIVVLNIDSWGAGVKLWEMSKFIDEEYSHSISDGVLEILGITSSFHIAQLQVGLNKPIRLGQGRTVKIKNFKKLPVQVDGEPWMQNPSEINITGKGQAFVLQKVQ